MDVQRNILTTVVTAWTTGVQTSWTVQQIRDALAAHARGEFSQSALLMDAMNEDDQIPQSLERRVQAVASADFEFLPVKQRKIINGRKKEVGIQESIDAGDWASDRWYQWAPEEEQAEMLRYYRQLGVAIGTLDWVFGSGEWRLQLRALPMEHAYWDETYQCYMYSAQQGLLKVTPGDGKWVVLEQGPRGYRRGSIRGMALLWLAKQLTFRDWNRYNERHGLPIVKATVPIVADQESKDDMWEQLRSLGSETVAELPTGLGQDEELSFGLELLEAKALSYDTFRLHLERLDRKIIVHYQGSNLGTEVTGQGSRAASESHDSVSERLSGHDAQRISTPYRYQLLRPAMMLNLGIDEELVPWPHWVTEAGADIKADADALHMFAQALSTVSSAGYIINNLDEISERYGVELVKKEEPTEAKPPMHPDADEEERDDEEPDTDDGEAEEELAIAGGDSQAGFTNGVDYMERLQQSASREAGQAYQLDAEELAAIIASADSPQGLRDRIRDKYSGDASESQLAQIVTRAMVLAQLAGRYSLAEDMESDGLGS